MTTNPSITVESFVLLLIAEQIMLLRRNTNLTTKEAFYKTAPIAHIWCNDGTRISIQAHHYSYAQYKDIPLELCTYPSTFGSKLIYVETDSVDLNQYARDSIECVEEYVKLHGGIDFIKTSEERVKQALD